MMEDTSWMIDEAKWNAKRDALVAKMRREEEERDQAEMRRLESEIPQKRVKLTPLPSSTDSNINTAPLNSPIPNTTSMITPKSPEQTVSSEESEVSQPSSPDEPLWRQKSQTRPLLSEISIEPITNNPKPSTTTSKSFTIPKIKYTKIATSSQSTGPVRIPSTGSTSTTSLANTPSLGRADSSTTLRLQKVPLSLRGLKRDATGTPTERTRYSSSNSPPPFASTNSRSNFQLPDWYRDIRLTPREKAELRQATLPLTRIKDHITEVEVKRKQQDVEATAKIFEDIRLQLHILEHRDVTDKLVKASRLLEHLPKLFDNPISDIPFDIVADAKALYRKWARQDFDASIMRGLLSATGKRHTLSLDPKYPNRMSAKFFGSGDLVSGQWWPLWLAAVRDGAHGAPQAGISGTAGKGAHSVVISGKYEHDEDNGDEIKYCGTEGKDGKMTDDTALLVSNIRNAQPVRVLRSGNNNEKTAHASRYAPESGLRYDGVYDVVGKEVLDEEKAQYRFLLRRQPGQDPIRFEGQYRRPSPQDKDAYNIHKNLLG